MLVSGVTGLVVSAITSCIRWTIGEGVVEDFLGVITPREACVRWTTEATGFFVVSATISCAR